MKTGTIQTIFLVVLVTLFSTGISRACDGLPDEVSTLMGEWEQAGVKTDCTVNQVMNWAVANAPDKGNMGAIMTDAMRLLNAMGYQNAQNFQTYSQTQFDNLRKNENGISKFFAAWKGSSATVLYMPDGKQYIPIQYREYPKTASSGFTVKIIYGSDFSDEQKKLIDEAVGWWRDRIADNFQITLDISLDQSINAGGTTLVGDVPRSCMDHQPGYAQIKLKEVNTSLVSHEIGHALGIGTAAVFGKNNVCGRLAEVAKTITSIELNSARIENDKFFGHISKGVLLVRDDKGDYSHVSSDEVDDDGHHSAVQPGLGGKPSLKDLRILEDLGYQIK